MNPESHKIVKEMEKAMPPPDHVNIHNPGATHSFLSIEMSRLLVVLAEDAEKSADKLTGQTDKLASQIIELQEISKAHKQIAESAAKSVDELAKQTNNLLEVANAQKILAIKAEKQGVRLIYLNWAITLLSGGLLAFAIVQTEIMRKQVVEPNPQPVRSTNNQQVISTNK
jgi:hypothetical protein